MSQRVIIISAMGKNRVIGAGDGMPWSVPEEYQRYLETVRGAAVVLGRRSYEIFGADLRGVATPVVVTSRDAIEGVPTAAGVEEAIQLAKDLPGETFIAGGASVYEQALPLADTMLLSTIHGDFEGDSYFPDFTNQEANQGDNQGDNQRWVVVRFKAHEGYDLREYQRWGYYQPLPGGPGFSDRTVAAPPSP